MPNDSCPPICPICDCDHSGAVSCDGTPIDWEARNARARAYLSWRKVEQRLMPDMYGKTMIRWWDSTTYPYRED